MVKHIVLYTLKDSCEKEATVERIANLLEPLVGQIPGLLWMEVSQTFQGGADYVLYSEFESQEALEAYQQNELHLAAKAQFSDDIATRISGDYDY